MYTHVKGKIAVSVKKMSSIYTLWACANDSAVRDLMTKSYFALVDFMRPFVLKLEMGIINI
jgi:hypothetical protein